MSFNLWVIRPAGCGTSIMVRSFERGSDLGELCKGARSFSDGGEVVSMLGGGAVPTMIVASSGLGIGYEQGILVGLRFMELAGGYCYDVIDGGYEKHMTDGDYV